MILRNKMAEIHIWNTHMLTHTCYMCCVLVEGNLFRLHVDECVRFSHELGDRFTQKAPLGNPSSFPHFPSARKQ